MRQAPCDSFLTRRREDAKRNHVNVIASSPSRLRVSPSLMGIIKELSVLSESPWFGLRASVSEPALYY